MLRIFVNHDLKTVRITVSHEDDIKFVNNIIKSIFNDNIVNLIMSAYTKTNIIIDVSDKSTTSEGIQDDIIRQIGYEHYGLIDGADDLAVDMFLSEYATLLGEDSFHTFQTQKVNYILELNFNQCDLGYVNMVDIFYNKVGKSRKFHYFAYRTTVTVKESQISLLQLMPNSVVNIRSSELFILPDNNTDINVEQESNVTVVTTADITRIYPNMLLNWESKTVFTANVNNNDKVANVKVETDDRRVKALNIAALCANAGYYDTYLNLNASSITTSTIRIAEDSTVKYINLAVSLYKVFSKSDITLELKNTVIDLVNTYASIVFYIPTDSEILSNLTEVTSRYIVALMSDFF